MTHTLLSLISIFLGILGANLFGLLFKKYSASFKASTIVGVFGSIFFVKFFGRLGFNPFFIVKNEKLYILPLIINCIVSISGGIIALLVLHFIKKKLKQKETE